MFKLGVAALAAVMISGSANATTLIGSRVYGELIADEFSEVTQDFRSPTSVSSYGDEFYGTALTEGSLFGFDVDISDSALVLTEKALSGPDVHEGLPTLDIYLASLQGIFPSVSGITSSRSPGVVYSPSSSFSTTNGINSVDAGAGVIYITLNSLYNNNVITLNFAQAAASAVPEPATWGMMILGMGAIGFAMRRRQKVSTTVSFA